jgi:uncharacterized membrane protein YdfJ with MMPL/SSD domain
VRAFVGQAGCRPWLVILAWLVVLVLANHGGRLAHPPAPSSSFLPAETESQRAAALEAAKFAGGHQIAEVVIVDPQGLVPRLRQQLLWQAALKASHALWDSRAG